MQAELQAHLDMLAERHIAAGLSPEEARYAAMREFGGVAQIAERSRDVRRSLWIEQLGQDLRYAVRGLARSPSFTFTAVLTLALGIGVNAALFSVVNLVSLRPLPVKDPDSLVRIRGHDARGRSLGAFNHAEYVAYRDGARTLDGLLAYGETKWSFDSGTGESAALLRDRGSGMVPVELVSENYFQVLGGPIQLGRSFLPEETNLRAPPVIVLSHVFWETRLQRDPNVIGSTVILGRRIVTVIGVASPEFSGQRPVPPAGWLPLSAWSDGPEDYNPDASQALRLIGRLKPGITEAQAKAELDGIASQWAAAFPREDAKLSVSLERGLRFMNLTRTPEGTAFVSLVIFGFGLVLVVACTNVANLLLARGAARQAEIGVRLTLGASRGRIVRQLLTENLLLCALGAVFGLGLATWTLQLLLPVVVSRLPVDWAMQARNLPFFQTAPDVRVLGFTALLTAGAALTAGLLPALHASSGNLYATVRNDGSASSRRLTPSKLRKLLVIAQVAISLTLLSSAGVLGRNLVVRRNADIGYDAHSVFNTAMIPNEAIANRSAAFRQALETVRSIPGIAASAVASPAPMQGMMHTRVRPVGAAVGGADEPVMASFISGGFFNTFTIPLTRGRTFHELEEHSASHVAIVSESLARRLWPGQEAVGQTLAVSEGTWRSRERPAPADAFRECEVVGVARDIMMEPLRDDRHAVYLPYRTELGSGGTLLYVRPEGESGPALAEIVRAAKAGGVDLQFERRHSFWVEFFALPFYAIGLASGALGALALGMASVGLYGLMSFGVNQRVHEIGVRMALGASAKEVVKLFVRQGMRLVAIGLVLGLVGGALFTTALEKLLPGLIDAFDPLAFGLVTLLFAMTAWFACWLPARRATKVDPMVALRAE